MNDRADYIGSADAPGVMGVSPWRTPFDIWAEHVHDESWQPQEETIQMRVGTYMEAFLADEYERVTGRGVFGQQDEYVHPDYPLFLRAHIDGRVTDKGNPSGTAGLFEGKTASSAKGWGTVDEPRIPEHYQAQCFFGLALTEAPYCDVAVLLPRGDFRVIRLDADEKVQRGIVAACVAFWTDHVLTRIPPPMDASPAASRWLARMPDDDEDALEAGTDLEDIIGTLSGVKVALAKLESSKDLLENQAKAIIGEHQKAVGRGWHAVYRRNRPFGQTKWKEAAQAMRITMQLHGLAAEADADIAAHTEIVSNRRPFILKREEDES